MTLPYPIVFSTLSLTKGHWGKFINWVWFDPLKNPRSSPNTSNLYIYLNLYQVSIIFPNWFCILVNLLIVYPRDWVCSLFLLTFHLNLISFIHSVLFQKSYENTWHHTCHRKCNCEVILRGIYSMEGFPLGGLFGGIIHHIPIFSHLVRRNKRFISWWSKEQDLPKDNNTSLPWLGVIVGCACCTHLHILNFILYLAKTSNFTYHSCDRKKSEMCSETDGVSIIFEFQSSYYIFLLRLDIFWLRVTSCIPYFCCFGRIHVPLFHAFSS